MDNHNTITWPGWETVRVIGRGSYGTVYEIQREIAGELERAALKHISIPAGEDEIVNLQSEGMDAVSITRTFQDQLNDILNEYKLMRRLNDCPYVVHCDDVMYVQKDTGFGWDVLIKMELLTPITKMLSNKTEISEDKVISLGKDISRALIRCAEHNILHRDIKIQNIFVSDGGQYKLGDFGIAKAKERTSTGTARIGTYDYMAPEIYFGKHYDKTADIYSLGMVLYWLLNNRRMPLLTQTEEAPRMQDRENARMRRLNGEKLPPPANGSKGLQKIVLKCCAYKPEERYHAPEELLDDLRTLQRNRMVKKEHKKKLHLESKREANAALKLKMTPENGHTLQADEVYEFKMKHRHSRISSLLAVVSIVSMLIIAGIVYQMVRQKQPADEPVSANAQITTPTPLPNDLNENTEYTLYYYASSDHVTIKEYDGQGSTIEIPSTIRGLPVTEIGFRAFHGCDNLLSISLPNTVTSIGRYAFYSCSSLTGIILPDNVKEIGSCAFSRCSALSSITIPTGVTSIGNMAFSDCIALTSISIPQSVNDIGTSVFSGCVSLKYIFAASGSFAADYYADDPRLIVE